MHRATLQGKYPSLFLASMSMAGFIGRLLLLPLCCIAVAQDVELANDMSECSKHDTCSTHSEAMSLLQLNAEKSKKSEETFVTVFTHGDPSKFTTEDSGYWIYGTYHRTGSEFARVMCKKLNLNVRPMFRLYANESDFAYLPFRNWYYQPDMDVVYGLPDYRFVHFIRDPADLIVSAYRFHLLALDEFLRKPMNDPRFWTDQLYGYLPEMKLSEITLRHNVPEAHVPLLRRFFKAVDDGKTLPEFYKSESETDGVLIEAYRSWWQIDMMQDNYEATRNDPKALQVRVENMKGQFEQHMKCIFNFLNKAHPFDTNLAIEMVDHMNFEKHGEKALPFHDAKLVATEDESSEVLKMVVWDEVPWIVDVEQQLSKSAVSFC